MRQDDERFLGLLHREQGKLLRLARMLLGREDDAWDLVQEATLAAYAGLSHFRGGDESFGPWIGRILVNRARNRLRAQYRVLPLDDFHNDRPDPSPGPEESFERHLLWSAVAGLDPPHRQVLALRYLADLEVTDIAAFLKIPEGTVKSRLHRAIGVLRQRLQVEDIEGRDGVWASNTH